ncbi:MAG: hypothetical protein ABI568_07050 [Pseudarthrobacter sp.]
MAALLDDVRELMRQKPATCHGIRRVSAGTEHYVGAYGECQRAHRGGCSGCIPPAMDPHPAKINPKPILEGPTLAVRQWQACGMDADSLLRGARRFRTDIGSVHADNEFHSDSVGYPSRHRSFGILKRPSCNFILRS